VFGGVSELESEPTTPRGEFLIAIVGPLTSFVLAGVCYGLGRALDSPPWVPALTGYLTVVNLLLALFNLVPGFPLDGGRLLRALLWWGSGDLTFATRWASRAGSGFAFLMMGLGIARSLGGEVVGGFWFILLGLFLHQAAQSSDETARLRARLEPLRVVDVMTPEPLTVDAAMPLSALLDDPAGHQVAGYPVLRGGRLVGFLPWSRVTAGVEGRADATAADAMLPLGLDDVVSPHASAWQAFLKVARNPMGRLAVVEDGRLIGIASRRDMQRALDTEGVREELAHRAA
jgi:CBS domain-containing protein